MGSTRGSAEQELTLPIDVVNDPTVLRGLSDDQRHLPNVVEGWRHE
jgi:hypothetical protein